MFGIRKACRPAGDAGFMGIESMGSLAFYLIMIAGVGILIGSLLSGGKLSEMEQGLSNIQMKVKQIYTGSIDYTGLDNALAIKSGAVPKRFRRGDSLISPWGGSITIATGSDVGTYSITIEGIPQEDCASMATYQADSWVSIDVNGTTIDPTTGSVATAAASCQEKNTITYTAR